MLMLMMKTVTNNAIKSVEDCACRLISGYGEEPPAGHGHHAGGDPE